MDEKANWKVRKVVGNGMVTNWQTDKVTKKVDRAGSWQKANCKMAIWQNALVDKMTSWQRDKLKNDMLIKWHADEMTSW